MTDTQAVPLLTEVVPAAQKAIGIITLNRPRVLNAFNVRMAEMLKSTLDLWEQTDDIAMVVLRGAGAKGFCAGGDVRKVVEHLNAGTSHDELSILAGSYFEREYKADYAIHRFSKPLLAWGHGLVFGGGWGLFAGASHRVATPSSQFAMPEILIGLFPDVAASWFLNRLPRGIGLFLGMTGARLSGADALNLDLTDHVLAEDGMDPFMSRLRAQAWSKSPAENATELHGLLQQMALEDAGPLQLTPHLAQLQRLGKIRTLETYARALEELDPSDPHLARAKAQFLKGSPTSAALIFHFLEQTRHYSLKRCFALDWQLVMHCSFEHDFREGIRALLIDKDQNPSWQAKTLGDVDLNWVHHALTTPFPGIPNPLDRLPE